MHVSFDSPCMGHGSNHKNHDNNCRDIYIQEWDGNKCGDRRSHRSRISHKSAETRGRGPTLYFANFTSFPIKTHQIDKNWVCEDAPTSITVTDYAVYSKFTSMIAISLAQLTTSIQIANEWWNFCQSFMKNIKE